MRTQSASFRSDDALPGTYIHAFARGLAVIRAFSSDTPEMTLSQVAERTGFSRANARRILLTLEQLGYVRLQDRRFRLTARILDLGFAYLSSMSLTQIAQPVIEDLASTIHGRCNVAVLDGAEIIYVLRIATKGDHDAYPLANVGRRFPAYATAMGRVLLGTLDPAGVNGVLGAGPLRALTPYTTTDPAEIAAHVAADRINGWSYVRREQSEATCSVGVPLRDRSGLVVASLGTGWFPRTPEEDAARRDDVLPRVLRAADEINRAMLHGHYDGGLS